MEPEPQIPATLAANLRALVDRDRALVERILLPVEDDHVRVEPDGSGLYRQHRRFARFDVPPAELEASLGELDAQRPILLFGIGLGEQLAHLLGAHPGARIVAWERDPWLLRLALIAHDFSRAIAAGRLELKLGVDLIDVLDPLAGGQRRQVVRHPFLSGIYTLEAQLLERGLGDKRALLAVGALFVDDLAECLGEQGYSLFPIDVHRWSIEELEHTVERFRPELVARINYTSGLAEFCQRVGCELVVWEIDPCTDRLRPCTTPTGHAHVYTYRQENLEVYRSAGFEHVEYLPLAANTSRRVPLALTSEELRTLEAPVSFVGSSMVEDAQQLLTRLCESYVQWHPEGQAALPGFQRALREILELQAADFSRCSISELFEEHFGDFLAHARSAEGSEDPVNLLAESAASARRRAWVAELASFDVHVWGDAHWRAIEGRGVRYRGSARHTQELTRIYNATRVNVDIGRLYQTDIVTMRVFDVLACGGFLVAERSAALEELFEVGLELEAYSTLDELRDKVAHYLRHPDQARAIAERGLTAVRERHSLRDRVAHMLSSLRSPVGAAAEAM